ncbi:helix-turn-helix domain-containing protein [Bacillus salipaludis]|uniref:Helix-turn-helix domain-containing protein n=1 Tax=Bacillus salipaludis TaxID=2547811 RepID=A0ABW8RE23_9BACI
MKSIGEIIRNQRQKLNLTMSELANLIGTSQSALSYIENDKRLPTHETISKICEALKMDENDLKEIIQIRNRVAHSSFNTKHYSTNNYLEKEYRVREVKKDNQYIEPDLILELYPGYKTVFQIKTFAKEISDHNIRAETSNTINKFIEKSLKELILKEHDWLLNSIQSQFMEYIKELEAFVSLGQSIKGNKKNEGKSEDN